MDQLQIIQNRIYEFRGQKVMLDCDLAEMEFRQKCLIRLSNEI